MSESDNSSDVETIEVKRKRDLKSYEPYKRKIARIQGIQFKTPKGSVIPKRATGENCRCKLGCNNKISDAEKAEIISSVNNFEDKNAQDVYLQGLMQCEKVNEKRKKADAAHPKKYTYNYTIKLRGRAIKKVCKKAFISLNGITKKRVERLQQLLAADQSPKDKRGKSEGSRSNAISGEICQIISDFVMKFPSETVYYGNNIVKKYLPSNLNVKMMHEMFHKKYPELLECVKYDFFLRYFHENLNLCFGRPQVNVCSYGEEKTTMLSRESFRTTQSEIDSLQTILDIA